MRRVRTPAAGFTLLELVVVMAVTAIVAVFMVFFLAAPVESYFAQTRRADLVDSADRILRNVAADVRSALPNSLRQSAAGGVVALELLATSGVARYYGAGDKQYLGGAQQLAEELAIGAPDQSFYTLGLFTPGSAGSYLAIDNRTPPLAYTGGAGVMTPPLTVFQINAVGATGEDRVQFPAAPGMNFASASPTHSVFVVSSPVSYLCDTNAQTLKRYTGYTPAAAQPTSSAQLVAAGATASLIAQNVSACSVTLIPAPVSGKFNQLVVLDVTLANSGEVLQVFHQAATEYLP
ncbi:MAG TPA: prepilin-type N-terminal cleavage/methylation domain-containing protein [Steroidobacteraceae bacterium]|nr:prepilin-type N-terminal cleavage/methylation domain-containing protein [Steroidobacteraceae bacterium]